MKRRIHNKEFTHPLSAWLKRTHPIPERFYNPIIKDNPNNEWNVWVTPQEMGLLYKAKEMNWISLKDSIQNTNDYLARASDLVCGLEGGWLDREERSMILENIGKPPEPCLPIYLITIQDETEEKLVYVGITKNSSRFKGGHSCALKLLNPKYDNTIKRIYRCSIWFHFNDEYIVLDWIKPSSLANEILESIESQFIYHFQPEQNIRKISKDYSKFDFSIHIQNVLDGEFLNDKFI